MVVSYYSWCLGRKLLTTSLLETALHYREEPAASAGLWVSSDSLFSLAQQWVKLCREAWWCCSLYKCYHLPRWWSHGFSVIDWKTRTGSLSGKFFSFHSYSLETWLQRYRNYSNLHKWAITKLFLSSICVASILLFSFKCTQSTLIGCSVWVFIVVFCSFICLWLHLTKVKIKTAKWKWSVHKKGSEWNISIFLTGVCLSKRHYSPSLLWTMVIMLGHFPFFFRDVWL